MRTLALAILILASAGLGCKMLDTLRGAGSGTVPAKVSGDPREDVIAASRKFIALNSFSAKMDGQGQTVIKSQVDYVAPDRFHVTYLAGTGAGMELIMIGSDSFMKPSGGNWSKMPGSGNTSVPTLRDSFTEEGLKTLSDVKFEGNDAVDGKDALTYSYKNVTPQGNFPFTAKIWIAKESGLPMKIYVEYSNGVLKNMTVNYDTESPVTIEPPIK